MIAMTMITVMMMGDKNDFDGSHFEVLRRETSNSNTKARLTSLMIGKPG